MITETIPDAFLFAWLTPPLDISRVRLNMEMAYFGNFQKSQKIFLHNFMKVNFSHSKSYPRKLGHPSAQQYLYRSCISGRLRPSIPPKEKALCWWHITTHLDCLRGWRRAIKRVEDIKMYISGSHPHFIAPYAHTGGNADIISLSASKEDATESSSG